MTLYLLLKLIGMRTVHYSTFGCANVNLCVCFKSLKKRSSRLSYMLHKNMRASEKGAREYEQCPNHIDKVKVHSLYVLKTFLTL